MDFDYRLISQGAVSIIAFKGRMSKDIRERIDACREELAKSKVETVVLFFRDVNAIDVGILRDLTLFQQEIRKNHARIFITGLSSQLRTLLDEKGVIRASEIKNSLEEILLQAV